MNKAFTPSVIFIFIAVIASLPTLYFLEYPVKYFLCFFEVILILSLFLLYSNCRVSMRFSTGIHKNTLIRLFNYFLLLCSLILLVLNIFDISSIIRVILSVILPFLLTGYVFMYMIWDNYTSLGERFVLSYAISLSLIGLLSSFIIRIPEEGRAVILCTVYVFVSSVTIVKDWSRRSSSRNRACRTQDIHIDLEKLLPLLLIGIFYVFLISNIYPRMAYFLGRDIVRHFSDTRLVSSAPQFYSSNYPWFHLQQAAVWVTSKPSMEIFQTSLAPLGIVAIVAFYVMAKQYLKEIDERLPVFATVFWSLFSGFGWIYFLQRKLENSTSIPQLDLILHANDKSYWDLMYGQSPWIYLWFRPITLGFTLFFVTIYLLKRKDFPRPVFISIYSLLTTSLFMFHASELIMLIVILVTLAFFTSGNGLRLNDALLSVLLGNVGVVAVQIILQIFANIHFQISFFLISFLFVVTLLAYVYPSIWGGFFRKRNKEKAMVATGFILLFLYLGGLFTWLSTAESFAVWKVIEIQFVPWLLYPALLGIVGFLGLIGFMIIVRERKDNDVNLFAYLFLSSLVIGRLISIINIDLLMTPLLERRFVPFMFSAASVMAAVTIIKAEKSLSINIKTLSINIKTLSIDIKKTIKILPLLLICFVVLSGITSTCLFTEFHLYDDKRRVAIGTKELDAISYLTSILEQNPGSPIYTVTLRSRAESEFAPSPWIVGHQIKFVWSSSYPELPMRLFNDPEYSQPYLYLHKRDVNALREEFEDRYLTRHLLPYIPIEYNNSEVSIYSIPSFAFPSPNSDVTLVVPFNKPSGSYLFVYDILSLGQYNYTVMLNLDNKIFEKNTIVLSEDINDPKILLDYINWIRKGKTTIIFNTDGYGLASSLFFIGTNTSININANNYEAIYIYPLGNYSSHARKGGLNASSIVGAEKIELPSEVNTHYLNIKNSTQILGWYSDGSRKAPFAARTTLGKGEIIYINVYPLIKNLSMKGKSKRDLYSIMGKLLNIINLELPKCEKRLPLPYNRFVFKMASVEGEVSASSSSLIFLPDMNVEEVKIETINSQKQLRNIKSISTEGVNNASVLAQDVTVHSGKGFYISLVTSNSEIIFKGENITISARLENGTKIKIGGKSEVKLTLISDKPYSVLLRQPHINFSGEILLKEAYGYHFEFGSAPMRLSGQDLQINGDVSLDILLSDTYTMVYELEWSGFPKRIPPKLYWDEWNSFKKSVSILFILGITLVVFSRAREVLKALR